MKFLPIACLLLLAVIFGACEPDTTNAEASSRVTAIIDGEYHIFNTVNVEERHYPNYTDIEVIASIDNDPTRTVALIVTKNYTGPQASWYFAYFFNETAYPKMEGFATQVTTSTGSRLIGTFSGDVKSIGVEPEEILSITNGVFDITF